MRVRVRCAYPCVPIALTRLHNLIRRLFLLPYLSISLALFKAISVMNSNHSEQLEPAAHNGGQQVSSGLTTPSTMLESSGSATPATAPVTRAPSPLSQPHRPTSRTFTPDPHPWPTRSLLYQYRPFRGLLFDAKNRLPYYLSDWTEGFRHRNLERVLDATIRMYFLK